MLASPEFLVPVATAPRRASSRARLSAAARLLGVVALHAGLLALITQQNSEPVQTPVTTIEVALIAPPAPLPVAPPEPAPVVPPPKPPEPKPVAKPPAPPKPVVVRKPTPKPAPRPAPIPAPTAINEPKEEAPPPAESSPAPAQTAPAAPAKVAPAPVAAAPQPIIAARFDAAYLNNPSPRYPRLSRRVGEQGKVLLRVLVSESGAASEVRLHQSSGHNRLDEAARSAVSKWTFEPARQGDRPIANWVIVPIEFKLENS
ncbi:MAG: energy transducer TonB [Rhodocyclaceae bacterium]